MLKNLLGGIVLTPVEDGVYVAHVRTGLVNEYRYIICNIDTSVHDLAAPTDPILIDRVFAVFDTIELRTFDYERFPDIKPLEIVLPFMTRQYTPDDLGIHRVGFEQLDDTHQPPPPPQPSTNEFRLGFGTPTSILRRKDDEKEKTLQKYISVYDIDKHPELSLSLIHDTQSKNEFGDSGSLVAALNTWGTIIRRVFIAPLKVTSSAPPPQPVYVRQHWVPIASPRRRH